MVNSYRVMKTEYELTRHKTEKGEAVWLIKYMAGKESLVAESDDAAIQLAKKLGFTCPVLEKE